MSTRKKDHSLGICTRYTELGASSRLRYYLYRSALEQAGFFPEFHPFFDDGYLKRLYSGKGKSRFAAFSALAKRLAGCLKLEKELLIEYELLPMIPAGIELALIGKRKYVLNFDDLVWEKYKKLPLLKNKFDRLICNAAGVITANHLLFEHAKALNDNVILIPTVVDLEHYQTKVPCAVNKLKAAWIGTPVTYRECFLPFADIFKTLCKETEIEFQIIARDNLPVIDGVDMTCVNWSAEKEAELLSACDIGIMPLCDDAFSKGKSAYKLIQYAATGLPAIASPVGENQYFITHGKNGFLANSAEEWVNAVKQLTSLQMRQQMAEAMQKKAFEYSLQKYAPILSEFLRKSFS